MQKIVTGIFILSLVVILLYSIVDIPKQDNYAGQSSVEKETGLNVEIKQSVIPDNAAKVMEEHREFLMTRKYNMGIKLAARGNRPATGRTVTMTLTAYTLRESECGKKPTDPGYGITASGNKVKEWYTIAAPKTIPFGTKIYIPYFKDKPNGGIFVVQDRGGGIHEGRLDVYIADLDKALEFGRRKLPVIILKE